MTCLFLLALLASTVPGAAQPPEGGAPPDMPPEMQAMMEAWQESMAPGEPHEYLAELAGSWKITTKTWMAPGAEPQVSEGTAEREMILGGRYLKEHVTGTVMGMPFEGYALSGYDNAKGKYWGTWVDNLSTGLLTMEGERDGDSFTWHAEGSDPMTGGTAKMRIVTTFDGPDRQVSKFYEMREGEEVMGMEIVYERQ